MIFCIGVFILVYSFFFQLSVVVDECRCSGEGVEFPDVEESEVGLHVCPDVVFVADGEGEVDGGGVFRPGLHDGEEGRGEDVEPGEGVEVVVCAVGRVEVLWESGAVECHEQWVWRAHAACGDVGPSGEAHLVVEDEIALRGAPGDEESGVVGVAVAVVEGAQADVGDDIDVVYEYGLCVGVVCVREGRCGCV